MQISRRHLDAATELRMVFLWGYGSARAASSEIGSVHPQLRAVEADGTTFPSGYPPPLLGDWIEIGTFDADRLTRKFEQELGGKWEIEYNLKNPKVPQNGYNVEINRVPGT